MSLAAHIKAQQTGKTATCKTCTLLATLDDEDRADFDTAVTTGVQGSVLGRAINDRLAELGRDDTLGEGSVRIHIAKRHVA